MANYSTLKAAVADVVKTNGTQAITGANLQAVLLSIINSVGGGGYIFKGVATPSTDAGTPDQNVFYIGGAGTYANFGASVTVPVGSIGVFKYNGSWTKEQIALFAGIDDVPTAGSDNLVKSGGVFSGVSQLNQQLNNVNIVASAAGTTPYLFKAGVSYRIKNNLNSNVTISHRNTPTGTSEDTLGITGLQEVTYTPTTDGLYLRYGAACNLTIHELGSVYDYWVDESLVHGGIAKYSVQQKGFITGVYWYLSSNKVVSISNSPSMAGSPKIPVQPNDIIRFDLSLSGSVVGIIFADASDNVIASYTNSNINALNGIVTAPQGSEYIYCNTLQSAVQDSYLVVSAKPIEDLQVQINNINGFLYVIEGTVQPKKAVNASTGEISDNNNTNAVVIDLTEVKAVKLKFIDTISDTYGYGFIVNGQWVGYRITGDNYKEVSVDVPSGATEFRMSWSTILYTGENPIYCLLEDAMMKAYSSYKEMPTIESRIENLNNAVFQERTINLLGNIGNGGLLTDGTFDTNNSFGHIEIDLDGEIIYKDFTFDITFCNVGRACYGFVVNEQFIGYDGLPDSLDPPQEVTAQVPTGATVFRLAWNRNAIYDTDFVLKTHSTAGETNLKNNPVFQFTPDFVLSRVPSYTSPTPTEAGNLTPSALYAMYDALMAAYPQYITKIDCDAVAQAALGITAPAYMDGLPIYMYKFTPKIGGNGSGIDQTSRVKVFLTSMHPQEKFGLYSTFYTAKMICENWTNDVNAEQLRSLVDIYIMPCPWTWNMQNNSRVNYNGVNGNRQFPTKSWRESGQGTHDWSGTAPLSEYEAKVINYFLLEIKPDVSVDVHTSGNDNVGHMGIMLVNQGDQPLIDLCGIIARTTSNRAIQDNTNFPSSPDTCLYGVYPENGSLSGEFYEYAYEQGCKYSILSEESPYSKWDNGVFDAEGATIEQYTDGILKEQIQYIYNTILRLTRQACVAYYKN